MTQMPISDAYFAAANSCDGFYSRFPVLFDPHSGEWQKIYIIKGGPGTGKSSFMKRAAEHAEKKGLHVERYYCSADPRSLDGIRIPQIGTAMLDGTAPHTVDPVCPGAVEEIINMGMFFDVRALREKAEIIRALGDEHSAHHLRAKRYLRAAGAMRETVLSQYAEAYLSEKAESAAQRLIQNMPREKEPFAEVQIVTAISAQGIVHLPTAERGECVYVTDNGRAALFFDSLISAAEHRGVSYVRYASPLRPAETEGISFPKVGMTWFSDRYGRAEDAQVMPGRPLNTGRFFDTASVAARRSRIRFARECESALLDGACEALACAGRVHDALEEHYIAAMDFDAMNAYTERFLQGFCE